MEIVSSAPPASASPSSLSDNDHGRAAATSPNVGHDDLDLATRQLDLCLDRGLTTSTPPTSTPATSEEIVGAAHQGRRDRIVLATKARMPMGDGPNDAGCRAAT